MRTYDHLIIGGGIAGTMAAETVRQHDATATIAIIGAETHRLYSRVLLPHVLRGKST
jgi:NAD(P)H-nitrite reductase large subunit